MLKGITKLGFRYEIDEGFLDDYELLELIAKSEENPTLIIKIIEKIFGEKQKDNLVNYLKKIKGKATVTDMNLTLTEIFNNHNSTKN